MHSAVTPPSAADLGCSEPPPAGAGLGPAYRRELYKPKKPAGAWRPFFVLHHLTVVGFIRPFWRLHLIDEPATDGSG